MTQHSTKNTVSASEMPLHLELVGDHCDFPGCIAPAFHDGDHEFAGPPPKQEAQWIRLTRAEWTDEWMAEKKNRRVVEVAPLCNCPQRDYPHDLSVHELIRSEWWAKDKRQKWPWSLMLSPREEPSTERRREAA
jgi:hypothetical protein